MDPISQILLVNGSATINLRGIVKSSIHSVNDDVKMSLGDYGITVEYMWKGKKCKQLVPHGMYSNVKFDVPEEKKAK